MSPNVRIVRHNRVDVAVHELRDGQGRALLLLHGLGECTPATVPGLVEWGGPVLGVDFTGHGRSTVPVGGGYTSEVLVADVDVVLEDLGEPVTIFGRGLGAYVGFLVAAARPEQVRGVVLADGPGLAGGGVHPGSPAVLRPAAVGAPPDPFALLELSRDVRPADYAQTFVRFVVERSPLEIPLWVATRVRPAWIEAIAQEPGVGSGSVADGLSYYAGVGDPVVSASR